VVVLLLPAFAGATTIPSLGAAGGYAVFALTTMQFNGPGVINGNVAVGTGTNFAGPAAINGTLYLNTSATQNSNISPSGGTTTVNLSAAITAAQNAPAQYNALVATQSPGSLGNNSTLIGNGGLNVIDVSSIVLTNGSLTLSGTANDYFIINDSGNFTFSNSDMALNGVMASHVLFNIGGNMSIMGGGQINFYGTFLDPFGDVQVHDDILNGEIIGQTVEDTSGFTVTNTPFTPPSSVPEPATWLTSFGVLAAFSVAALRRVKRSEV
jgi:hypothetical protein